MESHVRTDKKNILGRESASRCTRRGALQTGAALAAAALGGRWGLSSAVLAAGAAAPVTGAAFDAKETALLDAILAKHVTGTKTPGAAAGVWIPGRGTWVRALGLGDLATKQPFAATDKIRIASITKTFVATAVLQLVDAGKLGLDDVLAKYVPNVPNGDRATTRQLLNMTSGIFSFPEDKAFTAAFERDPLMAFTPDQAVEIARRHAPDFAPGASFHYSDTNYVLLGIIAEQVTGQSIEALIASAILKPLGLNDTSFPTTPDMPDPYARGYFEDPKTGEVRDVTRSNPNVAWTAGAMISTLADMKTWVDEVAAGSLLKPATQAARLAAAPIPGSSYRYGLGVLEVLGFVGHNGGILGYSTFMVHRPDDGATIVTATNLADNNGGGADALFADIARLLYPALFKSS